MDLFIYVQPAGLQSFYLEFSVQICHKWNFPSMSPDTDSFLLRQYYSHIIISEVMSEIYFQMNILSAIIDYHS